MEGDPDDETPDLTPNNGVKLTATATKLPAEFWYHPLLQTRFVPDPCEWDTEYEAGIDRIESAMREHPGLWKHDWIVANTTRCAPPSRQLAAFVPDTQPVSLL